MQNYIWLVMRNYHGGDTSPVCAYHNEDDAKTMCDSLTKALGNSHWFEEDNDPPFDDNGERDTAFKKFVRENFEPDTMAYDDLMHSADKFHATDFEILKVKVL